MKIYKIFAAVILLNIPVSMVTAQSLGDYRSVKSGNWNDVFNWETYDGTVWTSSDSIPQSTGSTITIAHGDTIIIDENRNLGSTDIEGTLVINAGIKIELSGEVIDNGNINIYGTIDFHSQMVYGTGEFYSFAHSKMITAGENGFSNSKGCIILTGTKLFDTMTDFVFDGNIPQITGNGFPSVINNQEIYNLEINNPSGVTLSSTIMIEGQLSLAQGTLYSDIENTIILGKSVDSTGTLYVDSGSVDGNFKRWISASTNINIVFPFKHMNKNRSLVFKYTEAPVLGGTITASFIETGVTNYGLPIDDYRNIINQVAINGYWSFIPGDYLTGGKFNISMAAEGYDIVDDYSTLRVLYRRDLNHDSIWSTFGFNGPQEGTATSPIITRTDLYFYGQFGIGGSHDVPLAVNWFSFNGKAITSGNQLNWATSSELNNDFFTVEKSSDGFNFSSIGIVNGAGNSNSILHYSFFDEMNSSSPTISYYRIKQTDYNGTDTYSEIISLVRKNSISENEQVWYSSNDQMIHLQFNLLQEQITNVKVYNLAGQLISTEQFSTTDGLNQLSMDASAFPSGLLMVNLDDENKTYKILK